VVYTLDQVARWSRGWADDVFTGIFV